MPSDTPSSTSGLKALVPIALDGTWRGRKWVVAAMLLGTMYGVFRAVITPSEYRSIGKLYVRPGLREVVVPDAAFAGNASGSLRVSGGREAILNELQVLASPELFSLVVKNIGADAVIAPYNPVVGNPGEVAWHTRMFHAFQLWWFGSGEEGAGSKPVAERDRIASTVLSKRVVIVPETGSSVISVYFHSGSPERAKAVVDGVLVAARELHRKVFENMASVEKIEQEHRATEELARQAEAALREFRTERGIYDFTAQHEALLKYLGELNQQLDTLDLEIKRKQGEIAALKSIFNNYPRERLAADSQTYSPNPEYAAWSSLLSFLRQQEVTLEIERSGSMTASTLNQRKEFLASQIAAASERLAREKPLIKSEGIIEANPDFTRIAQRLDDLEVALRGDESQRQQLLQLRNGQRDALAELESHGPQYRTLDLDAKQKRAAADRLAEGAANLRAVQRLEQLNLSNIQILQEGTFETEKIAPARARLVAMGGAGGAAIGVALAALLAMLGGKVRIRADLVRLGIQPHQVLPSTSDQGPLPPDHPPLPAELAGIRTDLARFWATLPYDRRAEAGLKVAFIRCGDADAGCAAATMAIGLALHGGERVVFVAGAGRDSWLARTFGLTEERGWASQVSTPQADAHAGAVPNLQPTPVPGLVFCPAGTTASSVRHPLAEPGFAAMLDRLTKTHRFVIVDLPDLASQPEARSVLGVVDAAYLVVRSQDGTKAAVRNTMAAVAASGAQLMGCVLQPASAEPAEEAPAAAP